MGAQVLSQGPRLSPQKALFLTEKTQGPPDPNLCPGREERTHVVMMGSLVKTWKEPDVRARVLVPVSA